jgi:methionine-rich copper-binding protein CopC
MKPYANHTEEVRQYLLGHLSEEIHQQFEERLLVEDSFLEELLVAEEELIDDYLKGDLSDDDRLSFEQHFLSSSERHQNLRFAMALSQYTANSMEQAESEFAKAKAPASTFNPTWTERLRAFWSNQGWALRAAMSFAVIAILAGALWLSLFRASSPRTFTPLTLTASVKDNRAEGPQVKKVPLPLKADALKISLILPEGLTPATSYRAELMNGEGETQPLEIAGQDAQSVSVVIPATQLSRGQYALKLFMTKADGTEQRINGNYYFTVE